jgi:hypothetical protein
VNVITRRWYEIISWSQTYQTFSDPNLHTLFKS